jgi:hypothetical protein
MVTPALRNVLKATAAASVLFVGNAAGARICDALDVGDRLFSDRGAIVPLVALGVVVVCRLLLYFVAPGLVIAAALLAGAGWRPSRAAPNRKPKRPGER